MPQWRRSAASAAGAAAGWRARKTSTSTVLGTLL
jgi:hypothetical protein